MPVLNATISPPMEAVMPDFKLGLKELLQDVDEYLNSQEPKPECPNHAAELTYEDFCVASEKLIGPFSQAVKRYYGNK
jgi:hypothetical protein